MRVLLLGVGMQGKAALHDLATSEGVADVVAADRDVRMLEAHVAEKRYGDRVRVESVDASDRESLDRLMRRGPDVAIDLLPAAYCGDVAASAVEHGVHLVNTFYVRPGVAEVADGAKARGVTVLPEFGMDPGIDLVLLGDAVRSMDTVEEIVSYGAGFPEWSAADNPLKYKVTWTFEGVLRSYIRAARVVKAGRAVEIPATHVFRPENTHEVDIDGIGRLEAFPNGDALRYADLLGIKRSDLRTMGRYALRWPGHCAFWKSLVDLHLLDDEPVMVDGASVDRRQFLAAAIEPHIRLGPGERDVVLVRIEVAGTRAGRRSHTVRQVIDKRDLTTGFTAMSRTVGYTASIGAQMIGTGVITKRGLLTPVADVPYDAFVEHLGARGILVEPR
jgi:lysine 6-dehydrogenase